ncbi:MAG: protein kinase, partial [Myxococcota bacterium]
MAATQTKQESLPREIAGGQYQLLKPLGEGGMGAIYYSIHKMTNQPVAVKMLHPQLFEDTELRARFFSEAKTMAALEHHTIVQWKHSFEDEGQMYIVMQYINGENLEDH